MRKSALHFDPRYDREVAQLFRPTIAQELAKTGACRPISNLLRHGVFAAPDGLTYRSFFESAYDYLVKNYRAEYVYKNLVTLKILLGRHSLEDTRMLSEFPVGDCKADLVLINGTATAYEIKTELDNLDRLEHQTDTYCRVFDRVFVVAHRRHVEKILVAVNPRVGVISVDDGCDFSEAREAASNQAAVDVNLIYNCLRCSEYASIIRQHFGYIPDVPNTMRYTECQKLFLSLDSSKAHSGMVEQLRSRVPSPAILDLTRKVPDCLKTMALTAPLSSKGAFQFERALCANIHQ